MGNPSEIFKTPKPIYISGTIEDEAVKKFQEDLDEAMKAEQTFLPIVINSSGGSCIDGFAIGDLIRGCSIPVFTIAQGRAASIAAFLFSFGERRFITPNSYTLVHEASSANWGKTADIEQNARQTRKINDRLLSIMSENVGQNKDYYSKIIDQNKRVDIYWDAKETLKHKLATDIGVPTMITKVQLETTLE